VIIDVYPDIIITDELDVRETLLIPQSKVVQERESSSERQL
jgi:hypothetical protein